MDETPNRITHDTAWGKPRRERSRRFYRVFGRIFSVAGDVSRYAAYFFSVTALLLLIYAGLFVDKTIAHASDGTMFSCRLPIYRGN